MKTPYDKLAKIYTKYFGHMTKMDATAIYGKSKLHGITALVINFLTSNQLLVNINQLFETLEEKK